MARKSLLIAQILLDYGVPFDNPQKMPPKKRTKDDEMFDKLIMIRYKEEEALYGDKLQCAIAMKNGNDDSEDSDDEEDEDYERSDDDMEEDDNMEEDDEIGDDYEMEEDITTSHNNDADKNEAQLNSVLEESLFADLVITTTDTLHLCTL